MTLHPWLLAFALTQLIEMPIHARALRLAEHGAGRWWLAFAASAATHPFVYFVFPLLFAPGSWAYLLIAETFAVAVEAGWLRRLGVRDPLLWSLVANASSVAVASALRALC